MLVQFFVPGRPVPKARARVVLRKGKVRSYTPEATADYEMLVRYGAANAMQGRRPLDAPVALRLTVCLPCPTSWSEKRRQEAIEGHFAPTKKPDADNYAKSALDALNGIAYRDDAQVVKLSILKVYSATPGLRFELSELPSRAAP
jgi:Holliday junction resolvase RusA-like endonuclease